MRRPSLSGNLSARVVLRVVNRCRAQGHDGEALCRSVGLDPTTLSEPDARVPYETAARLGERSGRSMAMAIAFHAGMHLDHIEQVPRSELGLHAAHLTVLAMLAIIAARSLARQRASGPAHAFAHI